MWGKATGGLLVMSDECFCVRACAFIEFCRKNLRMSGENKISLCLSKQCGAWDYARDLCFCLTFF